MSIAVGTVSPNQATSFNLTGTNPVLLVGITGSIGVDDITSVSYGGQSMTLIDKVLNPGTNGRYIYFWGLANPPTGTNNFQVNGSNSSVSFAIVYTGASATQTFPKNKATAGNGSTSLACAVTSTVNNSWIVGYWNSSNGNKSTAGSGTTNRDTSDTQGIMDSNSAVTPAGSYTLNQNNAGAGLVWICCAIAPAVNSGILSLL